MAKWDHEDLKSHGSDYAVTDYTVVTNTPRAAPRNELRGLKKGTQVRCITDSTTAAFTKNKIYTLREDQKEAGYLMVVEDDKGSSANGWHPINFELVKPTKPETAPVLGTQVGGSHYTDCAIQPIEYIWANGLDFSEGNIVKYVTRWKSKGGIKDLKKAHHHLALLIEREEAKEAAADDRSIERVNAMRPYVKSAVDFSKS